VAAASLTPEAFPAVTVPSSVNAGRSRARSAAVTSGRMCSSAATSTALHYLMMEALALVFPPRADMDHRYLLNSGSVQRQARAGPGQENRWPAASGLNQGDGQACPTARPGPDLPGGSPADSRHRRSPVDGYGRNRPDNSAPHGHAPRPASAATSLRTRLADEQALRICPVPCGRLTGARFPAAQHRSQIHHRWRLGCRRRAGVGMRALQVEQV